MQAGFQSTNLSLQVKCKYTNHSIFKIKIHMSYWVMINTWGISHVQTHCNCFCFIHLNIMAVMSN